MNRSLPDEQDRIDVRDPARSAGLGHCVNHGEWWKRSREVNPNYENLISHAKELLFYSIGRERYGVLLNLLNLSV